MSRLQDAVNRIVPLLVRNLYGNSKNPDALEAKRAARDAKVYPTIPQSVKPPKMGEEESLRDRFQKELTDRDARVRYAVQWEESKHPRATDGRFGNKAGEPAAGQEGQSGSQEGLEGSRGTQESPGVASKTAPPPGDYYSPDPTAVNPKTGYTEQARVGVPAWSVPPPPSKIPRLPNLNPYERKAETTFAEAFEKDSDKQVQDFYDMVTKGGVSDGPNVFNTDDAKMLSGDYNPKKSPEEDLAAKAIFNTSVHQTANAVAKRAFIKYLDEVVSTLPEAQQNVVVTAGGVASGKGYCIGQVDEVNQLQKNAGAVWDTAGEQNSTELPWVAAEAAKRGLSMIAVYVHAEPPTTWPRAVSRANKKGRMVDARVFADSYAIGAQNWERFQQENANNENVRTVVLDNSEAEAKTIDRVPPEMSKSDIDKTYEWAKKYLRDAPDIKPEIKTAGPNGERIWTGKQSSPPVKPGIDGQQSLFNVQQPAGKQKPKPKAASPLAGATADQRRVLANKPTISKADMGVVPQKPSKRGQKQMFSRSASTKSRASAMVAHFRDAFSAIGLR